MSMKEHGLAKLIEECGELTQVAGKMIQYPELQSYSVELHPDGTDLRKRLEEEIADVCAAMRFTAEKLKLNREFINKRLDQKLTLFKTWDKEQ